MLLSGFFSRGVGWVKKGRYVIVGVGRFCLVVYVIVGGVDFFCRIFVGLFIFGF
jgi:hypothetical protein